jgi:hypothetical protein
LPLSLERIASIEGINPDLAEEVSRSRKRGLAGKASVKSGRLVEEIGEARRAWLDVHFVPTVLAFDGSQPLEFRAHFLDFRLAENVLDNEITVLVEFVSLLSCEVGDRDPEFGKSHFGVHWRNPP